MQHATLTAAAPQVGQGTEDICSEVSLSFHSAECDDTGRETVQFCTLCVSAAGYSEDTVYPLSRVNSVVQDNTQERIVDVDLAVVLDEAEFPEFVHEKIDPRPRRANHLRQHLLRYFGKYLLRMAWRAIAREQQQSARQAFLGGVEELIYQILLDSDVSRQHIGDEAVGELVFPVEHANHLVFLNDQHRGGRNRGRSRHA